MGLTAAANLKLDKILALTMTQLKLRLAPLMSFSYVFDAKEVPRGKIVHVPYIPLEAMASKDWDPEVGYEDGDFNIEEKPVTVEFRKYQPLSFTSEQMVGLPIGALADAMIQKADKLASDITAHILTAVTAAAYGAPIFTGAAATFDSDDVADIDTEVGNAMWPTVGRNLILDSSYTGNLKKDDALKLVNQSGSSQTLRDGVIGRVSSFDVAEVPGFPTNGENLVGIAALRYGLLIANAPIEPVAEVKSQLQDYRVITDAQTGLSMVYRAWGNADLDKAKRVIEVGYGFGAGDSAQIKRLVSA